METPEFIWPEVEEVERTKLDDWFNDIKTPPLSFSAYQNHLGVRWSEAVMTNDVDVASPERVRMALDPSRPEMEARLRELSQSWEIT